MAGSAGGKGATSRRQFGSALALLAAGGVAAPRPTTAAAPKTLRLGHMWPANSIWGKGAQRFADLVGQESQGRYVVHVYPDGQLGDERSNEEGLGLGNLDCTFGGSDVLSQFEPKMGIFALPFLFPDYKAANSVMDGPIGQSVFEAMRARAGIRVIGSGAQGFRYILSRRPINRLADLKGMKIRVPQSDTMLRMFRLLGANPVAIPWTQTYMSEKTGVIDGLEGVPEVLVDFKTYETAKYIANTRHVLATLQLLVSDRVYRNLPPAVQKIVDAAGKQAWDEARTAAQLANEQALAQLRKLGEHFTSPDLAPFKAAVRPYWAEWAKSTGATATLAAIVSTLRA